MGQEDEARLRSELVEVILEVDAALGEYVEEHQVVRSASIAP
jgi:hypothetical protein